MNNRNWIALFFGLACLVLLIGVFSVSGTMNNGRNNTNPQQINQNLMTTKPKDGTMPSEINANDIMNGNMNTPNVSPSPATSPTPSPDNANNNQMPKISIPNMNP